MREKPSETLMTSQIKLLRKYLKVKIHEDNVSFRGHSQARNHVYDLIKSAVINGESHSALIIGPRGSGKTTLINSVLNELSTVTDLNNDAIIVKLNGLVHHDEKIALRAMTAQMQLENAVDGKVFGTFAEQLSFLLSCLTSDKDRRCRSMVFLLDECDLFCKVGKMQTLLYNLFDITHSQRAPMCVLGITNRIDVMDLLEKRVKSRFSHRHIYLFPNESGSAVDSYRRIAEELLSVEVQEVKKRRRKSAVLADINQETTPPIPEQVLKRCKIDPKELVIEPQIAEDWNSHVKSLVDKEQVTDAIEKFCYYMNNEQVFRNILFQVVSKLSTTKPYIDAIDLISAIDKEVCSERRVRQIQSLSVLELSLLIAMLHGTELLDRQPLNLQMVVQRYQKFAQTNSSTQSVPRPVIVKAFEHLQELELIVPARGQGDGKAGEKEHRLHWLAVPDVDIRTAVRTAQALPTEIQHWLDNSIM